MSAMPIPPRTPLGSRCCGKARLKGQASKRDPDDDQPVGRSGSRKSMVAVATERGGKARAAKGRTHSGRTVKPSCLPDIAAFVFGNVSCDGTVSGEPLGSTLASDELPACRWIGRKFGAHLRVKHSKSGEPLGSTGEYVRYDRHAPATAHVNAAEPRKSLRDFAVFNATLKRAWIGAFHWFPSQTSCFDDIKHTDRCLHETCFRWPDAERQSGNARKPAKPRGGLRGDSDARLADLFTRTAGRLRWKELVA